MDHIRLRSVLKEFLKCEARHELASRRLEEAKIEEHRSASPLAKARDELLGMGITGEGAQNILDLLDKNDRPKKA
jgi:hypothetical protein